MTTERALRLAEKWSNGLVCSLREGEAAEYHKMFLDMLRVKQEADQQGPCSRCGYGGQHLDAPPCTTCPAYLREVENSTPLTLNELRESVSLLRTKMSLPNEVLTNADRIRAMSYKELAKLFTHTVADGCPPDMDWECTKDCDGWDGCDACWERWLQQPAEEG